MTAPLDARLIAIRADRRAGLTFKAIGEKYGITTERARQLGWRAESILGLRDALSPELQAFVADWPLRPENGRLFGLWLKAGVTTVAEAKALTPSLAEVMTDHKTRRSILIRQVAS